MSQLTRYLLISFLMVSILCIEARAQVYFQQQVDYHIEVELIDSSKALRGRIRMEYTNHSPNTLPFIYMHLWPNAYKGGRHSALNQQLLFHDEEVLQFANKDFKGYIDSLSWEVNGQAARAYPCKDTLDIEILALPEPLQPGQTIVITTPFYVKLPSSHISRMGFKDHAAYLTQWYPKPAVYDDQGWHPISYLDKGEYFSEFGNYTVTITVPQNFVVAASGTLMNEEEIHHLDTLVDFTHKYEHPKKRKKLKKPFEPSTTTKTLTYTLNHVHDFAWCADPDFLLLRDTVLSAGEKVVIQTFVKRAHLSAWHTVGEAAGEALRFYTEQLGPYPFPVLSVVDADDITGGDMEYPTITWINHGYGMEETILHETGHNWLYGMLASNERDEPWMDEGLNTFYESLFYYKKYPDEKIYYYANLLDGDSLPYYYQNHAAYYSMGRQHEDQESKLSSHQLTLNNYWLLAYSKPVAFYWYLYRTCGEEVFKKIMQEYYTTWKDKHPSSADLHEIFKKYVGEKADWFFEEAMQSNEKPDYRITHVEKVGEEYKVSIKNTGKMNLPVTIETHTSQGILNTYSFDPVENTSDVFIPYDKNITWIVLDAGMTLPDLSLDDNYVRIKNDKKTGKATRFNFFTSFENPYKNHVYYVPSMLFNVYDGFQPGLLIHNYGILPKKTEWFLLPMLGTFSFRPNLMTEVAHKGFFDRTHPDRYELTIPFQVQSYEESHAPLWFFLFSPKVKFIFEKRKGYSLLVHEVGETNRMLVAQNDPVLLLNDSWKCVMQNTLYYSLHYTKKLWDIKNTTTFEHTNDFGLNYQNGPLTQHTPALKLYNELQVEYTYYKNNSTIRLRVFAGTFLAAPSMVTDTRFRLSGWNGIKDYAFNEWYAGRSETSGFFSQQMVHRDGDFKVGTFIGQTDQWMLTANLEADIPMIYAGVYMDMGTYAGAGNIPGYNAFVYNGGLYLRSPGRILQIYFPMISSTDIQSSVLLNTTTYWERIRFTLQLQNLKFVKSLRRMFI